MSKITIRDLKNKHIGKTLEPMIENNKYGAENLKLVTNLKGTFHNT